jgi:hypothetical protein
MACGLSTNTHLRELVLDKVDLDEINAVDLANGIQLSNIEELAVYSSVFDVQNEYWQQVCPGIQSSSTINKLELVFERKQFATSSLDWLEHILSSIPTLQQLSFILCNGIAIDRVLLHNLGKASSLTTLSLKNLDKVNIHHLVRVLSNSSASLQRLELEYCAIDNSTLQRLVDCWHANLTIRSLSIKTSTFDYLGLQTLLRAVATGHMILHELDLAHHFQWGFKELQILGESLPSLTTVTHVSCTFLYSLTRQHDKLKKANLAIVDGMKQAMQLRKVNISDHVILRDLEDEFRFYAYLIRHGRYLLATNHGLATSVWCHILERCQGPHAMSTIYFFLREQPYLVQPSCGRKRSRQVL